MRSAEGAAQGSPGRAAGFVIPVLLLCDIGFIALHLDARGSGAAGRMYRLDVDGAYAELFQHAKGLAVVFGLAVLAWRSRAAVYAAWALVFACLLLDQSLALHARGGAYLAERLMAPDALDLRPQKLCALAVFLAAGAVAATVISMTHVVAQQADRSNSAKLLAPVLLMLAFAICVDMLHIIWGSPPKESLTAFKAGGEMIAMTLVLSLVTTFATRRS